MAAAVKPARLQPAGAGNSGCFGGHLACVLSSLFCFVQLLAVDSFWTRGGVSMHAQCLCAQSVLLLSCATKPLPVQ